MDGADVLLILTEWKEFSNLDLAASSICCAPPSCWMVATFSRRRKWLKQVFPTSASVVRRSKSLAVC